MDQLPTFAPWLLALVALGLLFAIAVGLWRRPSGSDKAADTAPEAGPLRFLNHNPAMIAGLLVGGVGLYLFTRAFAPFLLALATAIAAVSTFLALLLLTDRYIIRANTAEQLLGLWRESDSGEWTQLKPPNPTYLGVIALFGVVYVVVFFAALSS